MIHSPITAHSSVLDSKSLIAAKHSLIWRKEFKVIIWLLVMSAIPIVAGLVRLTELAVNAQVTSANLRFISQPIPIVIHLLSSICFSLLAPFQFSKTIRRRQLRWHRYSGMLLILSGLFIAITGIWMSIVFSLPVSDPPPLQIVRLIVALALVVAILNALYAIAHKNIRAHEIWMIRAYAIAMGAATQVITHLPWVLLFGPPDGWVRFFLMTLGWVINIVTAEIIIRTVMKPVGGQYDIIK